MTTTTTPQGARDALGLQGQAQQPGTELSPLDKRISYTRTLAPAFADAVAAGLTPETLVRDAITALRNTPDLVKTEAQTFAGALMSAAQLGLRPNVPSLGHGWVLPFYSGKRQRHEAQFILGYQGMVELGYKSGLVAKMTTDTIYANERYEVRRGTADELIHEPILDADKRGEIVAHYAVVWLMTGQCLWKVMPDADVRAIMQRMAAKDRNGNIVGPWRDDYLPMAQKTPLRALWRFMPKTPTLSMALMLDGAVRAGTERDAALVDDEHPAESPPAAPPAAPDAPHAPEPGTAHPDGTVEAETVPDEPAPSDEPSGEPEPDTWTSTSTGEVRERFETNQARNTYLAKIEKKHGAAAGMAVEQVVGDAVPLPFLSTAELRAVADYVMRTT